MKQKLGAMLLALCLMTGMTATAFAQGEPAGTPTDNLNPPAPQETTVAFDSPDVFINIGEEQQLNVTVTPEVAPEEIQWKSSDEKIVTVDQTGKIHGMAGGEAFVSAEVDGVKAEILVIVYVPVRFTADTFADLDQDEILATLKKVLGPMETEGMSIKSKMMPNGQSMMLSHEIINQAWSVQLAVEANMLNADGSEAYQLRLEALKNQTLSAPVDLAVDIHKASEDAKLAKLFRGGKGLVVDIKGKSFPEGSFLYFGHEKYFGEETLTLYKVTGNKAVAVEKVQTYPENEIGLALSSGGVYVLSDLTEAQIQENAQAPETTFTADDLKNNKQAILDSLANTTEPAVFVMFTAADKTAVMPADVIEAAQASGKQLVAALQNEDGAIYMWLFNAYGQTTQQKAMDVRLYAQFTDVSAEAEMQALLGQGAKAVRIDLTHEGALPQGTVVTFPALSVFADGETVYLYELKDGKLAGTDAEGAPAKSVIEQGMAAYETTHCSSYIMTDVAQVSAAAETSGAATASPQTGDAQMPMLWAVIAVLALAGAGTAALAKRR